MNTARRPFHRPLKELPWYVNCTLEPAEARKVAAHVSTCHTCQREVGELAKMFSDRARAMPRRPVQEARLDELFSRIDQYEAQRAQAPRTAAASAAKGPSFRAESLIERLNNGIFGWLTARPALAGGVFAAVIVAIALPALLRSPAAVQPAVDTPYEVLSTDSPATAELRVRVRFQGTQTPDVVNQWVKSTLTQHKLANAYRLEPRQNGEYVVIFREKPSIEAVSRLLEDWRGAPNVIDVAIDAG